LIVSPRQPIPVQYGAAPGHSTLASIQILTQGEITALECGNDCSRLLHLIAAYLQAHAAGCHGKEQMRGTEMLTPR
ncbi:MAG TPA: hypothetical protein VFB63_21015, partial [Bryobacteraceae bacterium]|nr:hypothetical protein [Bryobacteraceae bacterium]